MSGRGAVAAGAVAIAALATVLGVAPARAELDGDCRVSIGGTSVATRSDADVGDAIAVAPDEPLTVTVTGLARRADYRVDLELAGRRIEVAAGQAGRSGQLRREIAIDDYTWLGVGVYRIVVEAGAADDRCRATALLDVDGSPFGTSVGIASTAAAGLGSALVVWAAVRARRREVRSVGLL